MRAAVFGLGALLSCAVATPANAATLVNANGVLTYTREIAARTETYWCPIKHSRPVRDPHARYVTFVDYGDPDGYRRGLPRLRGTVAPRHR